MWGWLAHYRSFDGRNRWQPKDNHKQVETQAKLSQTKASRFYWRSTGYKGKDHYPEDVQVHLSNKSRKKMTRWG
ncbi:hypothetical protein LEP1GSC170_6233 [Leptospira interrogans serovar Bataviae str. HAI135]|nr:hypothetical protein LEP1GSC170_6233 [Leptospira interrogans serovar Bataviae str. HAI135]